MSSREKLSLTMEVSSLFKSRDGTELRYWATTPAKSSEAAGEKFYVKNSISFMYIYI